MAEVKIMVTPRDFILNYLIPFIERDHGTGFCMSTWFSQFPIRAIFRGDGVKRAVGCGSVSCVGGSTAFLLGLSPRTENSRAQVSETMCSALGLTPGEAFGLFYGWRNGQRWGREVYGWPKYYRYAFTRAKTPATKAAVTAKLLKRIANGASDLLHLAENDHL